MIILIYLLKFWMYFHKNWNWWRHKCQNISNTLSPKWIIIFLATDIYHRRWLKLILWWAMPLGMKQKFILGIFIKNDTDDVINVKISQISHLQNGYYYFSEQIHIIEGDRSPFYGDHGHRGGRRTLYLGIFIKNDTDDVINVKISQIRHLQNG